MQSSNRFKWAVLATMLVLSLLGTVDADETCMILNEKAKKAKPSLLQCYRDNAEACCNSEADATIQSVYGGKFTDSCQRKYPVIH